MATSGALLFGEVGSSAGHELSSWCPERGRALRRNLLRERGASDGLVLDVGSFDGSDAILFATATRQRPMSTLAPFGSSSPHS